MWTVLLPGRGGVGYFVAQVAAGADAALAKEILGAGANQPDLLGKTDRSHRL